MEHTPANTPPRRATAESIASAFAGRATLAEVTLDMVARATPADARATPADAAAADAAIEWMYKINTAFNRMIAAGCDYRSSAMMVLAVLSSSPQTRADCRAWCVEHLSTRDDPTGTNMTKIVPSVPARRQ